MKDLLFIATLIFSLFSILVSMYIVSKSKKVADYTQKHHDIELTTPCPNDHIFLFRDEEIRMLENRLNRNERHLLVCGFGGIGKSALVRKFYEICKEKELFFYVAWIPYQGNLSKSINLVWNSSAEGEEIRVTEFLKKLQSEPKKKKLLVIDNVEYPEEDSLLKELVGIDNLYILLTSRWTEFEGYHSFPIGVLSETECCRLFSAFYEKPCDENIVLEIVHLVRYHTLSVEILAKTAKRSRGDLREFLNTLEKMGIAYSNWEVSSAYCEGKHTMVEYLKMLFTIEKRKPEEVRILRNFALMPSVEIPVEVMNWIKTSQNMVENLVDAGWLNYHEASDNHHAGYYMHPLVRETVLLDKETFPENIGAEFVACLGEEHYFEANETYVTVLPKLEIADSVLTYRREWEKGITYAHSCYNLATMYYNFGQYEKAKEYYGEARTIRESTLGLAQPDTAATYDDLAEVYDAQGKYAEAEEYYLKALAIREAILGTEHLDTVMTYNNLSNVYYSQRKCEKAEEYCLKALVIYEKILGKKHPDTAKTYDNLATICYSQEKYDKAKEYCLKALDIYKEIGGKEHPDTAMAYNNLANIYQNQGKYAEAESYYLKALSTFEAILGKKHPSTAMTYNNLAIVYAKQRKYVEAEKYYLKALPVFEAVFGEEHPNTATIYNNLADTYQNQGMCSKAEEYYKSALSIREEILGKEHPSTAESYFNIAELLCEKGDYDEAMERYLQGILIFGKMLGWEHPNSQKGLLDIAKIFPQTTYAKNKSFSAWCNDSGIPEPQSQ